MIANIITQSIIDNIKPINISSFNQDENDYINEWIKVLLEFSMDENNSYEVGVILDTLDWAQYDKVKGKEHSVKFDTDKMRAWLQNYNDRLILIHNHPSDKTFSERDLLNFARTKSIHMLIVVGNKGSIYTLRKLTNFDKLQFAKQLSKVLSFYKGKMAKHQIIRSMLNKYDSKLGYEYKEF